MIIGNIKIHLYKKSLQTLILSGLLSWLVACGSDGIAGTGIGSGTVVGSGASASPVQSGTALTGKPAEGTLGTVKNYMLYGGATVPNALPKELAQRDIECPKIDILAGTAALRVGSTTDSASGVNYQASMGQTVRECRLENNKILIRVGVEGRVLIGTNGKPGTYSVPVRVAIKREKNVIYSKLTRISVTIPNGDTQASFTHVEEGISVPLTANNPADEYDILVGFDPTGKAENAPRNAKRKRG